MSALTSLLVRDEVVSVRQIEDALARQVLEGGELDTALLELDAASENALNAYRAASFRLPSVTRDEVMSVTAATRSLVPDTVARRFRIIPITHDTTSLLVATANPLGEAARAEISHAIGMRVECCIASEVRIEAALASYYGAQLSDRMERLAGRVDLLSAGSLPAVEPMQETPISGLADELFDDDDDEDDERAEDGTDRVRLPLDDAAGRVLEAKRKAENDQSSAAKAKPEPERAAIAAAARVVVSRTDDHTPVAVSPASAEGRKLKAAAAQLKRTKRGPAVPQGPLTTELAAQLLERADERDAVVDVFFRYARQYFDATALFSIREDRALGREVHNVPNMTDIHDLSVAIARGSMLDELVRTLLPRVGDLSRKEEDHPLAEALRRVDAQPSALLPIAIQRRVVSVVYGDRGGEYFRQSDLQPLIELLPEVSRAFERIIRTRKVLGMSMRANSIAAASAELGHAATQLNVSIVSAPIRQDVFDASKAESLLSARRALSALGAPRTAPPPPAAGPRAPQFQSQAQPQPSSQSDRPPRGRPGEGSDLDRIPTLQLPAVTDPAVEEAEAIEAALQERVAVEVPGESVPEPPPRGTGYLSKPPPGAGRYSSMREGEGDEPDLEPSSDTKPLRGARSHGARAAVVSAPDGQPEPQASDTTRSAAPRASKPPPGTGTYRQHDVSQEVVTLSSGPPQRVSSRPAPRHEEPREQHHPQRARSLFPPEPKTDASRRTSKRPPSAAPPARETRRDDRVSGTAPEHSPGAAARTIRSSRPPQATQSSRPPREPSVIVDTAAQLRALVEDLCKCGPDDEGETVKTLLRLGEDSLDLLVERFPGPLWFDRRRPYARLPFGRDTGPIARALAAFGDAALPRLIPLLRSNNADVRYYATLFVSDQVHPELLGPISERLFDDDPQIRLMVRDALPLYRQLPAFVQVLNTLRIRALDARSALPARLAAIDAITMLRDGASVPTLVELLTHADRQLSVPAHRALVSISCQDFGTSPRKWRSWYEDSQHRHRVQWLIESLMHSEQNLRSAAGIELQKVTQVYYGYVASAPKRDRERAQKRYQDWWDSDGRKKL